jgi:hypothetical protein
VSRAIVPISLSLFSPSLTYLSFTYLTLTSLSLARSFSLSLFSLIFHHSPERFYFFLLLTFQNFFTRRLKRKWRHLSIQKKPSLTLSFSLSQKHSLYISSLLLSSFLLLVQRNSLSLSSFFFLSLSLSFLLSLFFSFFLPFSHFSSIKRSFFPRVLVGGLSFCRAQLICQQGRILFKNFSKRNKSK